MSEEVPNDKECVVCATVYATASYLDAAHTLLRAAAKALDELDECEGRMGHHEVLLTLAQLTDAEQALVNGQLRHVSDSAEAMDIPPELADLVGRAAVEALPFHGREVL